MSEPALKMVSVFAARYSGSTWLCLMLGSHSTGFCVGEPNSLLRRGRAICRVHGDGCAFWSRYAHPCEGNLYRRIAEMSGRSMLVMSTPSKFVDEQFEPGMDPRMIHLMRDGRAVVASILRKGVTRSVRAAAAIWKSEVRRSERLAERYGPDRCLLVHYERLQAETESELKRVCGFLDIGFEPAMLEPSGFEHHYLGGNRGTLFGLLRKRSDVDAEAAEAAIAGEAQRGGPKWDLDFYRGASGGDFARRRWRSELSRGRLAMFALAAGRLNRRYGYGRSDAGGRGASGE